MTFAGFHAGLEFGFAITHTETEGGNEFAFFVELLDSVVGRINNEYGAGGRHSYSLRFFELTAGRAFRPELGHVFMFTVELLNPVVARIGNPDVPFGVNCKAKGS